MTKSNVTADAGACSGGYSCQIIRSLVYTGAFNPLKARIVIRTTGERQEERPSIRTSPQESAAPPGSAP